MEEGGFVSTEPLLQVTERGRGTEGQLNYAKSRGKEQRERENEANLCQKKWRISRDAELEPPTYSPF